VPAVPWSGVVSALEDARGEAWEPLSTDTATGAATRLSGNWSDRPEAWITLRSAKAVSRFGKHLGREQRLRRETEENETRLSNIEMLTSMPCSKPFEVVNN